MIKPLPEHILVEIKRDLPEETESGIALALPDRGKIPYLGVVVAVAEGVDPAVKVGQTVIYNIPSPRGFEHEGKHLLRVHNKELQAIWH